MGVHITPMKTTTNITTPAELKALADNGKLVKSHTSLHRGYVSRKGDGIIRPYSGRFGSGWLHLHPSQESTRYHQVTYYIAR